VSKKGIEVTGIHLLRLGDYAIVNAEIDGQWVEVIKERYDGSFSHIVEPDGMRKAAPCKHEFGGWREIDGGRGGERFCQKCGLGAMAATMPYLP